MPHPQPSDHTESILSAVSHAAKSFASARSWRDAADGVLAELGEAVDASRVYIFRNLTDDEGRLCMDEIVEWAAPGISPTMGMPDNHGWPYADGYEHYKKSLSADEVVRIIGRETTGEERETFATEGILSAAFVPIFVRNEWWGYIGFDDCVTERRFSDAEVAGLRTASATLGAAIQRGRLEERARVAESRFRDLVEHIPAALYIDDASGDGRTAYIAPQIQNLLGISVQEWLEGMGAWEDNLHPDDRDWVFAEWDHARDTRIALTQEYRMIRPDDGRVVWIRDDTVFVTDDDGEVRAIQGVMFDITAQKEAEAALAAAQARFQQLVEHIPTAVYTESNSADPDYPFYISPQVEHVTGHGPESFQNRVFWEAHLHPDDREAVVAEDARSTEAGEPFVMDYRFIAPDGSTRWLHEEGLPVTGPDGKDLLFGVISNVTAQKEAEHRLALAQEQYQSLVEGIPAMVYLDSPGELEGSLYVSPRCEEILGITAEAYKADPQLWLAIVHPDDRDRVRETNDVHLENGTPLADEYRVVRPDGSVTWVNEQAEVLLDEEGKP